MGLDKNRFIRLNNSNSRMEVKKMTPPGSVKKL